MLITSRPIKLPEGIERDCMLAIHGYGKSLKPGSKGGAIIGDITVARPEFNPGFPAIDILAGEVAQGLPVFQIMVNTLHPGAMVKEHIDPWNLSNDPPIRYHVPIWTNGQAVYWDAVNGEIHMEMGHVYGPIPYHSVRHSVRNLGLTNRIHMIVDVGGLFSDL